MEANLETLDSRAEPREPRWPRRRIVMWAAFAAYLAASVALIASKQLFIARDLVFVWVILGLLILSLNDVRRWFRGLLFDWLPFFGILFFYDLLRNFADNDTPFSVHYAAQIKIDKFLFGSPIPTIWLQRHYYHPPAAALHDYAIWIVYLTHFFATVIVAAYLWKFAYPRFKRWRSLVLWLSAAGFVTYFLYPADPPWLAAAQHHIGHVEKIIPEMFRHTHMSAIDSVAENKFANKVAAVPSLHAAFPMLMLLFFWRSGWISRIFFAVYTLAMATTLVYSAEHYVSDILIGWLYAGAIFLGLSLWWRRRERQQAEEANAAPAAQRPPPSQHAAEREPEPVSYSVGPDSRPGPARS